MIDRKSLIKGFIYISIAVIISSCGGGGGETSTGAGGPDVSPDTYTETDTPATNTVNTDLTGTTTAGEGTVVETSVDIKIEGSLDTNTGDTGLIDAGVILDGAVSGDGGTTGSSTTTGGTDSTSGASTGGTTASGDTTSTSSGTSTSGTTSAGTTTAGGPTTTGSSGTAGETVTGDMTLVSGDVIDALEDDEAVDQEGLSYTVDSSQGKWYNQPEADLFSSDTQADIKAQIAALREEIKTILLSYKDGGTDKNSAKARIKQIREKIADLRSRIGNGGRIQTGIYTDWSDQNLYLNINKAKPGWYRLIVVTKNKGKLPDNYDRFNFNINDGSNDTIGALSVKASDNVYYSGSTDLKLDNPAGMKLNLVWTNDAYMKDKYNACVNIKKVILKKIKEPEDQAINSKHMQGDQFSFTDGRWFSENRAVYTFWANQVIGYTFRNLEEGLYEITVMAKNYDSLPLPKDYKEFNIEIDSDYDSAAMNIKADDKNWNKETVTMNFPEGNSTVYFTWTNESFKKDVSDANLMLNQ